MKRIDLDILIVGGGAAGLWLLDVLARKNYHVLLLEAHQLGSGQTATSQGIIHGGLKYTLKLGLTASAKAIAQMPDLWRASLAGDRPPLLTHTQLRADHCHLWRTKSLKSRFGMIGAKKGLRVAPVELSPHVWPEVLSQCPQVFQLNEQVISPQSLIDDLAHRHCDRILKYDLEKSFALTPNEVNLADQLTLRPKHLVLTAGAGNAGLCEMLNITTAPQQRRPLHMVMLRGNLPTLNGHCADGAHTRVTVTTDTDTLGRTVWQVGGQVAEVGVNMTPQELIQHTRHELEQAIVGIQFNDVQWATYRVDRAEGQTRIGARPHDVVVHTFDNVTVAWPTKLALVPRLADVVIEALPQPTGFELVMPQWPRPVVAQPPWEVCDTWTSDV